MFRGLSAGAKEIRTLRPTLNASVPRGATWVPRTAPGFGVAPPSSVVGGFRVAILGALLFAADGWIATGYV
jgi:hypothetical protein